MKIAVVVASTLAVASAFAPAPVTSRAGTELLAKKGATEEKKKPFFESVFGMDLFAPNPTVNTYGARANKNVSNLCRLVGHVPLDGFTLLALDSAVSRHL